VSARAEAIDPQLAYSAIPRDHRLFRTTGWFARSQPTYAPRAYAPPAIRVEPERHPDDTADVEVPE
jgi:hypothetical protein